jgi:hypothetical protein
MMNETPEPWNFGQTRKRQENPVLFTPKTITRTFLNTKARRKTFKLKTPTKKSSISQLDLHVQSNNQTIQLFPDQCNPN